jgi:tetratricopeptide (TPR) repeat protein
MADLGKLLNEQDFESIDEVNAFLENLLAESGGMIPVSEPETPLEKAQELVYQAQQTENIKKAIRLARKALDISEECADAYLLLGNLEAETLEQMREYFEKAVAAAQRSLPAELFTEAKGHFWGLIETRPYMRARAELANLLWELGEPETAIGHYREMLELNPGDNQGLRYVLLTCLLQLYRNDEAVALLKQYDDDAFATWHYHRALLAFRQHGRSPEADEALEAAIEQNEYIPEFLLGLEEMPFDDALPDIHGWGDESEAVLYAVRGVVLWAQTPGAQRWLAEKFEEWS